MKKIAISVNFDSIRTIMNYGSSENNGCFSKIKDPCFFQILDRFLEFSAKFNFEYSFYFVGKDLESELIAKRVYDLYSSGHEIGNHSYSHFNNLGDMPIDTIEDEIMKTHALIKSALKGAEPEGFISPGWSSSGNLVKILVKHNYLYDTSLFPSPLMPLIQLQLKLFGSKEYKKNVSLIRKDFAGNLIGNRRPYWASPSSPWKPNGNNDEDRVFCLPLPTISFRIPFWHSVGFKVSRDMYLKMLKKAIKENDAFYLLVHPLDLFDPVKDLGNLPDSILAFERMRVPINDKLKLMNEALSLIASESDMVTMKELATHHIKSSNE